MHVGLVIYGPLDKRSGGYLYDHNLVEHLRASGDRVTVFSLPERSYTAQVLDNVDRSFWQRLSEAPLDVLLQDELCHLSLVLGNWWLRGVADYPILSIVHHLKSDEERPPLLNATIAGAERVYLRSVDGYIVNSQSTLEATTDAGGAKAVGGCSTRWKPTGHATTAGRGAAASSP